MAPPTIENTLQWIRDPCVHLILYRLLQKYIITLDQRHWCSVDDVPFSKGKILTLNQMSRRLFYFVPFSIESINTLDHRRQCLFEGVPHVIKLHWIKGSIVHLIGCHFPQERIVTLDQIPQGSFDSVPSFRRLRTPTFN